MEVSLEIQDYHQLSRNVRHVHCPTLEEFIKMGEDINFATQQARHLDTTREKMYKVFAGYLGKLSENLVKPYANASTK